MPGCRLGLALLFACAALLGCGGSDDEGLASRSTGAMQGAQRGILETIDALQTASRRGDSRQICQGLFTQNLVRSIETSAKRSCPVEVRERLFTPDESISVQRGIRVNGPTASAVIREQNDDVSTLHLLKQAGQWRIDRVSPQKAG